MGQDIKQRERLSNVQIFAMMTRLILAAALLGVYRAIMEESGRDAWISLILGAVVIAIAIVIIYNLNKHYPELTIIEYTQLILGKWGGRIVGLAFVLYLLFVSGMLLRFFGELVNTWILRETPLMVILGTTLILTVYLASKGLTTLGRYCIIITILMFWVEIFLFFLAPQWEIKNLLPIGKAGSKSILSGILPSIFAFGGYEILLLLFPYVQEKRQILRTSLTALAYSLGVYLIIFLALILYFGPNEIQGILYPPLKYLTAIEIPVIERIDYFVFFFSMFSMAAGIGVNYSMTCLGFSLLFPIKSPKLIPLVIYPFVLWVAWMPQDLIDLMEFYRYVSIANIIVGIGLPFLLLLLTLFLKRKRGKENESLQ